MAQIGVAIADTTIGTYTDQAGGAVNIYLTIDEGTATPSDADYIRTVVAPSVAIYVNRLTSLEDPQASTGHIWSGRYAKSAAGGAQINYTRELRQGYVSEASQGTLIKSLSYTNISNTFATDNYTLTGPEADAITDYSSLYERHSFTQA